MGLHSRREREAIMREIRLRRDGALQAFLRELRLPDDVGDEQLGHAAHVPAVAALRDGLALDPRITVLVGANGSGKSTLLEAIAVACGLNPEGGGPHLRHATRDSHSPLGEHLRVTRGLRIPDDAYFLRAESLFTIATALDELAAELPEHADATLAGHGGGSLHERSHGEAFLAIARHRLGPDGFYVLDEPEAALSAEGELELLRRLHELVLDGGQFVIATHSPLLLAYPRATILRCAPDGVRPVSYDAAGPVAATRALLRDHRPTT